MYVCECMCVLRYVHVSPGTYRGKKVLVLDLEPHRINVEQGKVYARVIMLTLYI